MTKKSLLLLIASLCLGPALGASNSVLPSVPQGHWSYAAMQQLASDGLVKGDFSGNKELDRADFALQLAELSSPDKLKSMNVSAADLQLLNKLKEEFGGEIALLNKNLKKAEDDLAKIGDSLDEFQQQADDVLGDFKTKKYGGSSNPAVSGSYGFVAKDIFGDGRADRHGVAMIVKIDMSLDFSLADGSHLETGFGPAFSPGSFISQSGSSPPGKDDTDEIKAGTGTGGRAGSLMGAFRMKFTKGALSGTAGFQSFQTSLFTLTGPLSDRPILFEKNPYMSNIMSKSYYESNFFTGVPKRSAEESEFYLMGFKADYTKSLVNTSLFYGYDESFYDFGWQPMIGGGTIKLDGTDHWRGTTKLIGYNRTNDSGELAYQGGNPSGSSIYHSMLVNTPGLFNDTVLSLMAEQKAGPTNLLGEYTHSNFDNSDGVHAAGAAWRLGAEYPLQNATFELSAYSMDPLFGTHKQLNGANLFRIRPDWDINNKSGFVQQTVVADPTRPIANTTTYKIGAKARLGNLYLNFHLQNSQQNSPTDARIWSHHFLNGENLNGGDWFVLFNNNYVGWYAPLHSTYTASTVGIPDSKIEPVYFINTRGETNNLALDAYNKTYVPKGVSYSANPFIVDQKGKYDYASYHQMEAGSWRQNYEGFVVADPQTGMALDPSTKSISDATLDSRLFFAIFGRNLFWHTYTELMTVNDSSLVAPSMDASNLFVQGIADTTLAYNVTDPVVMLLYMGYENWTSDRTAQSFINMNGERVKGTLEYHDRSAGVGLDWNARPGKLAFFSRAKIMYHYDASALQNNFIDRQLMVEMKTYF